LASSLANQAKNTMKLIGLLTIIFVIFNYTSQARETWTLNQCIQHALENNIYLKIRQNNEQNATYSRQQRQWGMLPSVNGWGSSGFNSRRSTNQNNEIASGSTYNLNYGISSSMTLFSGFTRINTISALKYNELAGSEGIVYASNQLAITVTDLFTQVVYQKALVKVMEEQLNTSKLESERIAANISAGLLEAVAQLEIDAMVTGQELQLHRAQNEYMLTKLKLAHLIEIPEENRFDISSDEVDVLEPNESQLSMNEIYLLACQHYPTILQREYQMAYYKKMLDVTKGYAAPSISLGGSYSSAFYSTDTLQNGSQTPFGAQLENYLNPSLGLSLSVPIFNGRQNDFAIKQRKIDVENALYELENQKKTIRREIEEALMRLESFRLEYLFAGSNLVTVEKSFETFRERYRLGLINSTEFMNAQNQLAHAQSELLRTKYSWVVQKYTLELYKGSQQSIVSSQ
jgi:outer membrane protein